MGVQWHSNFNSCKSVHLFESGVCLKSRVCFHVVGHDDNGDLNHVSCKAETTALFCSCSGVIWYVDIINTLC